VETSLPVPYLIDLTRLAIDDGVSFIIASLIAVMINAEGQAFVATAMGDVEPDRRRRHHFNAFLHLDLLGSIAFLIAGFGWPKKVDVDATRFSSPRRCTVLIRFGGPVANFLMAGIAGSIVWVMTRWGAQDRVFTMVAIVNVTTAVYHLIPIPPLAGASLIEAFLAPKKTYRAIYERIGPYFLIGVFLLERFSGWKPVSSLLNPWVTHAFNFIINA
jgi:Zn-dependent protease